MNNSFKNAYRTRLKRLSVNDRDFQELSIEKMQDKEEMAVKERERRRRGSAEGGGAPKEGERRRGGSAEGGGASKGGAPKERELRWSGSAEGAGSLKERDRRRSGIAEGEGV